MKAWRLCRVTAADLSGRGARRHGGRWTSPGRAVVYAAAEEALAILELQVHLDLPADLVPDDYVMTVVDLSGLAVEAVEAMPEDPRAVGDLWLAEARSPVLRIPSALVPGHWDVLLNPAHPAAAGARVVATTPFTVDPRLWR